MTIQDNTAITYYTPKYDDLGLCVHSNRCLDMGSVYIYSYNDHITSIYILYHTSIEYCTTAVLFSMIQR